MLNSNGNDTLVLSYVGTPVDIYGAIGVDGDGEPWDYADRSAQRGTVDEGSTSWEAHEWSLLDGLEATPGSW